MSNEESHEINNLLSELTDHEPNVYELTKDLARVAKQVKDDTKEDTDAPKPVLESVKKLYESKIEA